MKFGKNIMSRVGKKIIKIPEKVEVKISDSIFSVKGPQGELSREVPKNLKISIEDGSVSVSPTLNPELASAIWGTYSSHVANMIEGASKGFEKKLLVEGIGFKADLRGDKIVFALGFSHPVEVQVPKDIKVSIEKNAISIFGADKETVGSFASYIRSLKKPEPYKGKGIRYDGEVVKIKQGKKSVT